MVNIVMGIGTMQAGGSLHLSNWKCHLESDSRNKSTKMHTHIHTWKQENTTTHELLKKILLPISWNPKSFQQTDT